MELSNEGGGGERGGPEALDDDELLECSQPCSSRSWFAWVVVEELGLREVEDQTGRETILAEGGSIGIRGLVVGNLISNAGPSREASGFQCLGQFL